MENTLQGELDKGNKDLCEYQYTNIISSQGVLDQNGDLNILEFETTCYWA